MVVKTTGYLFLGGTLSGGVNATTVTTGGNVFADVYLKDTEIAPGFSPGTLTVNGSFYAYGGNTFNFEVDANGSIVDQLVINGEATIQGSGPGGTNSIVISSTGLFPGYSYNDFSNTYQGGITFESGYVNPVVINGTHQDSTVSASAAPSGGDATGGSFDLTITRTAPFGAPEVEPEPEPTIIVVIIDGEPVALPEDIVDVIVTLSEEEKKAYVESEKVKTVLKKINMCVASSLMVTKL